METSYQHLVGQRVSERGVSPLEASARFTFTLDVGASQLVLVVENTSPVMPGIPNPVITDVFFNVPSAVTGIMLTGQASSGGAPAAFSMALDQKAADLLWASFEQAAPDVSVAFQTKFEGLGSPVQARVTADLDQVFKHQLFQAGVAGSFFDADIEIALDSMITNNVIKVSTLDLDTATNASGGLMEALSGGTSTRLIGTASDGSDMNRISAALANVTSAIDAVSNLRADFGAKQNRLESAVRNMENVIENQSAARSRVLDADFARETANLTRTQILQQAGTAMLAQANALPQNVLSLLR